MHARCTFLNCVAAAFVRAPCLVAVGTCFIACQRGVALGVWGACEASPTGEAGHVLMPVKTHAKGHARAVHIHPWCGMRGVVLAGRTTLRLRGWGVPTGCHRLVGARPVAVSVFLDTTVVHQPCLWLVYHPCCFPVGTPPVLACARPRRPCLLAVFPG